MYYIKSIFVFLFFASFVFHSCHDDNSINLNENNLTAQESITLQSMLNQISHYYNDASVVSTFNPDSLCFQFVYPIKLIYNNQNTVTISNFNGLIEILNNQTNAHHIVGINMPFSVTKNGQTQTISNQENLIALLVSCNFTFFNEEILNSFCFDFVFPINLIGPNGQTVTFSNIQGLTSFLNTQTNNYQANIVFPISVIYNNQTVTISNLFALNELINSCSDYGCVCTQIYAPVCIQTPNGIVEYGNMCYAECDGYTQANIVPCNNGGNCSVFNLTTSVGNCGADDTFSLTLDFDYNNAGNQFFEVFALNNVSVGIYPLSQLPITIANFPDAESPIDYVRVQIKDRPNCSAVVEFPSPDCGGNDTCACYTLYDPVCVMGPNGNIITFSNACFAACEGYNQQDFVTCNTTNFNFGALLGTCFTIQYPVQVPYYGQNVTINSNPQLLQYYFPNEAPIPQMNYPITVTFINITTSNTTMVVNSQAAFIQLIQSRCN